MGGGFRRLVAVLAGLALISGLPLAAADPTVTIEPYTQDEFPGWLHDLRRAEIVSLGSLPFVTMGVSLGYSLYRYFSNDMNPDYFPNPFAKSSSAARLSTDEQLGILFTSLGIAAVVGMADLAISTVQRHQRKKEQERQNREGVEIILLEDAVQEERLPPPEPGGGEPESQGGEAEVILQDAAPLVQSECTEFLPFGLFVSMPQPDGAPPDA